MAASTCKTSLQVASALPLSAESRSSRAVKVQAFALDKRAAGAAAALAGVVLLSGGSASHALDTPGYRQLKEIVHSRGTELVLPQATGAEQAKQRLELQDAPPTVTVDTLKKAGDRTELFRAEAMFESQAAALAMQDATSSSPAARQPGVASASANTSSGINRASLTALLNILGVLGIAATAAYLLAKFNEGIESAGPLPSDSLATAGSALTSMGSNELEPMPLASVSARSDANVPSIL